MELADETKPGETAGGIVVTVGVETEGHHAEHGKGRAKTAARLIPGKEVGIGTNEDSEVAGGIGG